MKRRILSMVALLILVMMLFCGCLEVKYPVSGETTTTTNFTNIFTSTLKKAPKLEEIDLSDADISSFEISATETDYVIISVENYGEILVRLFPDVAPETVNNFKGLVSDGFYDGLIFHRVIENFMIQGGGYTADMVEKQASSIKGEFSSNGIENNLLHVKGVISMARTSVKDSASSQFFIMHKASPHLDGEYAAFGYAVDGREVVDAIASCHTNYYDVPSTPVVITSIKFAKLKPGATLNPENGPPVLPGGGSQDPVTPEYVSSLPAADWNGKECLVLGHSGARTMQFENLEIWREEMTNDVLGKAVWERNKMLKDTYNFEVKQNLVDVVKNEMADLYKSGEDLYDICLYRPLDAAQHAEQEFLLDLASVEYIDLDHASWDQNARADLAITGKLYFTVSDFLLQDKDRTEILFYNREMARNNGWGYLEDKVTSNGWTVEYFAGLVKAASKDGNSNLVLGDFRNDGSGDYFGLGLPAYQSLATFAFGAGVKISELDNSGNIIIKNDKITASNIVDKLGVFLFDKNQTLFVTDLPNTEYNEYIELFGWEKELFCADVLSSLDRIHFGATISELVDFEYSVLPYPKASASQDRYYSTPSGTTGAVVAIPYTVSDVSQSGFFLQALSEASTDTTLEAFWQYKTQLLGADERTETMLGIIFDSVRYDIGAMYDFGGLYTMYYQFAMLKRNRLENQFDSRYEAALIEAAEIMGNFND